MAKLARRIVACALVGVLAACGLQRAKVTTLDPAAVQPGLVVSGHVKIPPGTYYLPDTAGEGAIRLASGAHLDLAGVTLVGSPEGTPADEFAGTCIRIRAGKNQRVEGGTIRGYRSAVWATDTSGIALSQLNVSNNFRQRLKSTPEAEDSSDWMWPHYNEDNEWLKNYGAAIYIEDSTKALVIGCRARDGQNGIVFDGVTDSHACLNDCSFMSGWGIALYRSSDNRINNNRFDFCVRGYSHGVYQRGQDSAGILLFEQCQRNTLYLNSATYSGDGFFLYAGHQTVERDGHGGSNDNVVIANDFSHAVANGIEATFSTGNFFDRNRLDDCNYGVWAGYSSRSYFIGNASADSRFAGIAIEHGQHNLIEENRFERDQIGVWLWWDPDEQLAATAFGQARDLRSHGNWLVGNEFVDCGENVKLVETTETDMPPPEWKFHDFAPWQVDTPLGLPEATTPPRSMHRIVIDEWGPVAVEPEYSRGSA